jgi:hypothetical protein
MSFFFISCTSENAPDCFQDSGNLVQKEVTLPSFSKITVFEKVALVLQEGPAQKVVLESGKYLINEVSAEVEGDRLILRNDNGCNLFREYGITTIYVTAPNINEIRSSTGLSITSEGVLPYPSLTLFSESFNEPTATTTDGSFALTVDAENLNIIVNGIAYFQLSGSVENLNLNIAAGDSRIEAENLVAQNVILNHRGTNDMLVNPQEQISGVLRGTGDVQSFNRPENVDVEELYTGRLIFRE